MQFIIPIASITQCNIDMASLKLVSYEPLKLLQLFDCSRILIIVYWIDIHLFVKLALVAVVIAAVAADKAPEYAAPTYSAPTYNYKQPVYDYKPAEGRVKIQVTCLTLLTWCRR